MLHKLKRNEINKWLKITEERKIYRLCNCWVYRCIESSVYFNDNKMCRDAVRSGEWCSRRGRDGWRGWVCVLRDGRRLSIRAVVRNEVADMFYAVSHSLTSMCISAFHINASMQIICPPAKVAAPCNLARIRNRFDTGCMSNTILFKHHFYKYCLIFFKNLKIY